MNGGLAWVWDPHATLHLHLDSSSVTAGPVEESAAELRALLERHREATRSVLAAHVLGRWESCRQQFVLVTPGVDRTPLPQPVAASSATR
jgi:glutamate synthase domain-containing protein 3